MDWNIADKGRRLISFTKKNTDLRHKYPMLRHGRFLKGTYSKELNVKDVTWLNANGSEMGLTRTAQRWRTSTGKMTRRAVSA